MRDLAKQIVTDTAVAAGLAAGAVIDKPQKRNKLLHQRPRIEFETIGGDLENAGGVFARLPGDVPETHSKIRKLKYREKLKVRIALIAEDAENVEALFKAFILALPKTESDADNNLVKISAARATRGGFEGKILEALPEREVAVWINFEGVICSDEELPLIKDATFDMEIISTT